jgi:hypothetical protein
MLHKPKQLDNKSSPILETNLKIYKFQSFSAFQIYLKLKKYFRGEKERE